MKTITFSLLLFSAMSLSSCDKSDCNGGDPNACACYEIYAPVCGCDGETYGNDCRAECAGISDYTEGPCS